MVVLFVVFKILSTSLAFELEPPIRHAADISPQSREEALDGIKKNAEDFRKMFASVGVDLPFDSHAPFLASTHAICPGF